MSIYQEVAKDYSVVIYLNDETHMEQTSVAKLSEYFIKRLFSDTEFEGELELMSEPNTTYNL